MWISRNRLLTFGEPLKIFVTNPFTPHLSPKWIRRLSETFGTVHDCDCDRPVGIGIVSSDNRLNSCQPRAASPGPRPQQYIENFESVVGELTGAGGRG